MKKWATVSVVTGIVLLLLGGGLWIGGAAANGWSWQTADYERRSFEAKDEVHTLEIDVQYGEVTLSFYEGERVRIEYEEQSGATATLSETSGALRFQTGEWRYGGFTSLFSSAPQVNILLPQGIVPNLRFELDAGTCEIASGAFQRLDIELNAGTLTLDEISCTQIEASVNAGTMTARQVTAESAKLDLSAGSVEWKLLDCTAFSADVSAGSANVKMKGAQTDYGVLTNVSAGSCNLGNQTGTTNKSIKCNISAGSITFFFEG